MKTKPKLLFIIAFAIATAGQVLAQGYIVPNGVVVNFGGLFFPGEIDVLHNPAAPTSGGSYTGFSFDPQGKTPPTAPFVNTFLFNPVVDIGVRVFLVSPNDPISLQPILAHSYTELSGSYVFDVGTPFYVGLYTGNVQTAPQDGIYNDPLFGWAKLVNNNGVIQLLDSALVYQAGGVFAGTQTIIPVPEPRMLALAATGALALGCHLRERRRQPEKNCKTEK